MEHGVYGRRRAENVGGNVEPQPIDAQKRSELDELISMYVVTTASSFLSIENVFMRKFVDRLSDGRYD
jgi:hypothetical protein